MGKLLEIPLRNIAIRVRWEVWSFDGDVVSVRATIGPMTLEAEISSDDWTEHGGSPQFDGFIETAVV